jgi:hypothetical protein
MNLRSAWLVETGQTREDTRLSQLGATTPVNPLQVASGILPGSYDGLDRVSGFSMDSASAMVATVHEGRAVIQSTSGTEGAYPVTLPETLTLTFADGDPQYGRIDLVVIRIYDDMYDASGRTEATVEIVQGAPGATPAAPAAPPLALPLYQVTVPAGTSAGTGGISWSTALTDLRTSTVAIGGIVPAYGVTSTGAYPGQYMDSGGALQRWDGSAWVPYPSVLGGIAPAGMVTTASYTGQYRDGDNGVLERWNGSAWITYQPAPAWTDYTPVWRAETGTAPSIGNGTLAGSYTKLGTLVHVRMYLKMGSTTNLSAQDANANWNFSLPFPPASDSWKLDGRVLSAVAFSNALNHLFQGSVLLSASNGGVARSCRDTLNLATDIWDKSAPFTWAAGDVLSIFGSYESAS